MRRPLARLHRSLGGRRRRGVLLRFAVGHERGELSEVLDGVERVWVGLWRLGLYLLLRLPQNLGRQKFPRLGNGAGSVTGHVPKRAGTSAVGGPHVVGGVAVSSVWRRRLLHVRVRMLLWVRGSGLRVSDVAVGWRHFIWVAGGDAALVQGPAGASGFILVLTVDGRSCGCSGGQ